MSYTIKANRSSVHIAGIEERTQSTGADNGSGVVPYYAESACGALTRSGYSMQQLGTYDDIADAIKHATYATYSIGSRKVCKTCLAAAEALLAEKPRTCTACGEPVEFYEGIGWVEIATDGHYDLCPDRYIEETDTQRGHTV